jgi:O-antigen ligase
MISLMALPFGFMTLKGLFGILAAICLFLSLLALIIKPEFPSSFFKEKYSFLIILCFSAITLSLLLTQAIRGDFSIKSFDGPIRFLLAFPILIAIYKHRINFPKLLSLVIPSALLSILIFAILGTHSYGDRLTNYYLDPIFWGNFSIILGFVSLSSIHSQDYFLLKAYKLFGLILGISMSVLSQSRAGWIAAIIMSVAWLYLNHQKLTSRRTIIIYGFLICVIPLNLYLFVETFQHRVDLATMEFFQWLSNSNSISSTSVRLNMITMGIDLVSQAPFIGHGNLKDFSSFIDINSLSTIEKDALNQITCCGPHNELLANTLRSGVFGFLASIALYLVPIFVYLKNKNAMASSMGIMLSIGVFVAGFFTEMLGLKISYTFYAILTAGLIATTFWQKNSSYEKR